MGYINMGNPDNPNSLGSLLRESVLVQALITLLCVITMCYMWISGQQVPIGLTQLVSIVIGFYFGTKSYANSQKVLDSVSKVASNVKKIDIETKDNT